MTDKLNRSFRIGTTSFIFPDHIIPNVKKLGLFFDEIELLVFESLPEEVLPSKADVKELQQLGTDLNLTYNVHLPTDISLADDSEEKRQTAVDIYLKVLERFEPLDATTHTLHLELPQSLREAPGNSAGIRQWQAQTADGLEKLVSGGADVKKVSIETLDYPFALIDPLVKLHGFPVCIDLGHAVKYGYDPKVIFEAHAPMIPLMHLHGVDFSTAGPKDHTRLDRMPDPQFNQILCILKTYTGTVSIEVFNGDNLNHTLSFLSQFFLEIPGSIC